MTIPTPFDLVRSVDRCIQRAVDACAHALMRRFDLPRWRLIAGVAQSRAVIELFEYGLQQCWVQAVFGLVFWSFMTSRIWIFGPKMDTIRPCSWPPPVLFFFFVARAFSWGLSVALVVFVIRRPELNQTLDSADRLALLAYVYLFTTPPTLPPRRKRMPLFQLAQETS